MRQKAEPVGNTSGQIGQAIFFDIGDIPARLAHEMVVLTVMVQRESLRRVAEIRWPHQAESGEDVQCAVYRAKTEFGVYRSAQVVNLVWAGVTCACLKHR
ncbi:MAG: hypothetical protein U0822_04205 [Anaerolineae bacterium]